MALAMFLVAGAALAASSDRGSQRFIYSMGLGKRYSPYSFGLGKRSGDSEPNRGDVLYMPMSRNVRGAGRHVFSFGLGKRSVVDEENGAWEEPAALEDDGDYAADYLMEKRGGSGSRVYSFGLGKRGGSGTGKSFYSFGLGKRNVAAVSGGVEEGEQGKAEADQQVDGVMAAAAPATVPEKRMYRMVLCAVSIDWLNGNFKVIHFLIQTGRFS